MVESIKNRIRLYGLWGDSKGIRVCNHIFLPLSKEDSTGSGELEEILSIHCDICGKTFDFTVLVN